MLEVQDVFCEYGAAYESSHAMTCQQQKAFRAIRLCRTSALGGHVDECPECGYQRPSYNSCRNRHCPKCQMLMKERWIENQSFDLLNIQYFHVVFTVPAELNPLFLSNQEKLYRLLFSCAAETLTQLAWDKRYLGAQIGCIEVLHTWGQRLDFHPHIHCIVPGGGLNRIGQWVSSRKKFFIPVKVLSRMFRSKFPNSPFDQRAYDKIDSLDWTYAKRSDTEGALQKYLDMHPDGKFAEMAREQKQFIIDSRPTDEERSTIGRVINAYFAALTDNNKEALSNITTSTVFSKSCDFIDGHAGNSVTSYSVTSPVSIEKRPSDNGPTYNATCTVSRTATDSDGAPLSKTFSVRASFNTQLQLSAMSMKGQDE